MSDAKTFNYYIICKNCKTIDLYINTKFHIRHKCDFIGVCNNCGSVSTKRYKTNNYNFNILKYPRILSEIELFEILL